MLEVIFLQEQSMFEGGTIFERYAKIISREEELVEKNNEKLFLRVIGDDGEEVSVDGATLLETDDVDIVHNPYVFQTVERIVKGLEVKPDVIFSTSIERILQISRNVEEGELELHFVPLNSQKDVLYYGKCGKNDSTLLVAHGCQNEVIA